jgi:aspartyl-tRNA(Asn)/glutamyl-tRNA(Gln) amidotransferase subunit A
MMPSTTLHEMTIAEAGRALRAGEVTSVALAEASLASIASMNDDLNAFILVTPERALADARQADADFAAGIDKGPMQGVPYGLKDIFDTAGIRTTCHSRVLIDNIPKQDCVVAERLAAGGGVLVGKVGTYEFAIGGPSFDLLYPPARNPWNREHTTGGSSSGSASAVAASMVPMAMGSDTGGSIRGPAAYCGIVGLKPTYGRVPKRGVFPLSYTLDHCGPLTRTVEDAALSMQVIAGHDALDPHSVDLPVPDFSAGLGQDLAGLKIAYARDFLSGNPVANPEIIAILDATAERLASLGATVEEITLEPYDLFAACQRTIMYAEAFAIHEQDLKTRPMAYGRYAYQRLIQGGVLSAADYIQALRLRRELTAQLNDKVLGTYNAILAPTGLTPAPRMDSYGEDVAPWSGMMTGPFNATGHPALAFPIGFSANGLPLGAQLVGRPFDEPVLFRIAAAFEASAALATRRPEILAAA